MKDIKKTALYMANVHIDQYTANRNESDDPKAVGYFEGKLKAWEYIKGLIEEDK